MILDEAMLEFLNHSKSHGLFRFYTWSEPTLSIGYFQNVSLIRRLQERSNITLPIVRRITGGGMVRHGADLTLSLAFRRQDPLCQATVKESYRLVHEAIQTGLSALFPALSMQQTGSIPLGRDEQRVCFDAPTCYDLVLNGRKVVGSSQRRTAHGLLHQTTIRLPVENPMSLAERVVEGFRKAWGADLRLSKNFEYAKESVARMEERYRSYEWSDLGKKRQVFLIGEV